MLEYSKSYSIIFPSVLLLLIVAGISMILFSAFYTDSFILIFLLLFSIATVPLLVSLKKKKIDIFEPIVFKSVFMFMIIIALIDRIYLSEQYLRNRETISFTFTDGFLLLCILYVILFSSIILGYYLSIFPFEKLSGIIPSDEEQNCSATRKIAGLYITIGILSYLATVTLALDGNPLYIFTSSEARSQVFASSTAAVFRLLSRGLYMGYFLYLTTIVSQGHSPRIVHLIPFPGIVSLFALFGGRGMSIQVVLMFIMILYYVWVKEYITVQRNNIQFKRDKINSIGKQLILPVIALGTGGFALLARQLRRGLPISEAVQSLDVIQLFTFGIHNSKFDYFLSLISMNNIGPYFGTLYLRVPLNFIPRSIWEEKPVLTVGSELRRLLIPHGTGGRPPGEIGVYYANFSYLGIIIMGILCGIYLRIIYEVLNRNAESPLAILLYTVVALPVIVVGLTNNSLWMVQVNLLFLLPVIVVHYTDLGIGNT